MNLFELLSSNLGQDGTLVVGVLVVSGLALLIMGITGSLRGRSDIRRRTSEGVEGRPGDRHPTQQRPDSRASLHRLAVYLDTTFGGIDPHEKRLIQLQLI